MNAHHQRRILKGHDGFNAILNAEFETIIILRNTQCICQDDTQRHTKSLRQPVSQHRTIGWLCWGLPTCCMFPVVTCSY